VTNCRCKRVSTSGKTKREQSISKAKKVKKKEREKAAKKRGGRCSVSAAACLPLRNTRVAVEIDSYGDPKEQKTNECFTQCERERERQKNETTSMYAGAEMAGPVLRSHGVGQTHLVAKPTLCSRGRGQEPTLWLSLATFTSLF
jgi:hypothetical protein